MKRIIYMVLMNLLHAPIWFFTISRMAREEDTRTAAEKYGYISEMVKTVSYTHLDVYKRQLGNSEARAAVDNIVSEQLTYFLEQNPAVAKSMCEKSIPVSYTHLTPCSISRDGTGKNLHTFPI